MTSAHSAAVAVAANGLAGSRIDPPVEALAEPQWFDLVEECRSAQLVGFLAATVARGDLAVSAGQAEELSVLEAECAALSLLVEQRVLTLCSLLDAAGVAHRVLDGPARHRLAYAGSGVRTYESAELLVPADQLEAARRLPGSPVRRTGRGGEPVVRRPRVAVRSAALPASWESGTVGVGQIAHLSVGVPIEVAGRQIVALSIDEQLIVTCVELATDRFSPAWLLRVRDVAELALSPGLDPGRARHLAEQWGAVEVLAEMLALVWQLFDLADKTELSVWARRFGGARRVGVRPRRRRPAERSGARAGTAAASRAAGVPDLDKRPEATGAPATRRYR